MEGCRVGVGMGVIPNERIFLAPSLIPIQDTGAESSDRPNASQAPFVVNPFYTIIIITTILIIILKLLNQHWMPLGLATILMG